MQLCPTCRSPGLPPSFHDQYVSALSEWTKLQAAVAAVAGQDDGLDDGEEEEEKEVDWASLPLHLQEEAARVKAMMQNVAAKGVDDAMFVMATMLLDQAGQ